MKLLDLCCGLGGCRCGKPLLLGDKVVSRDKSAEDLTCVGDKCTGANAPNCIARANNLSCPTFSAADLKKMREASV